MAYTRHYHQEFVDDLKELPKDRREAIDKKIDRVMEMPEHFEYLHKAKRIQKARVGKYRILFRVSGDMIEFFRARKRDEVYKP